MNNKEYLIKMANKLEMSSKEVQKLTNALVTELAEKTDEGYTVSIQGFGNFEVKKKLERIVVNPTTRQRMLVPPKLLLSFKPSNTLNDKLK